MTGDKPHLTRAHVLDLLRQMIRIRRFEDRSAELYTQKKTRGFLHLYDGQEAVAVGVIPVLGPDDRIVATYREHGHALARVVPMDAVMAEVIDLSSLRPLDEDTIAQSVTRTRRAVVVDEGWRSGSLAGEVIARIAERCFWSRDAPPARVCTAKVPIPYPAHLETAAIPRVPAIVAAARATLGKG